MTKWPRYPLLIEVNAFTWIRRLSKKYGKPVTLGEIPPDEIRQIAATGCHALWLMGVWQRSPRARDIAASLDFLRREYAAALPGYEEADITGSPYAVKSYSIDKELGGESGLHTLRRQLHQYNINLVLDFIPNHLAIDHEWVAEHPEYFVQGTELDLKISPDTYFPSAYSKPSVILAHGRAPFAPGWTDTVQLDYRRLATREAMMECLLAVAALCDGVRCDMAMLLIRDVFLKTWPGRFEEPAHEFWSEAIPAVKSSNPSFIFIGEVYWDYEYRMQRLGFDFVYDKILYDRVLGRNPHAVSDHLFGGNIEFQSRLVRFVENHDEKRVAALVPTEQNLAAAALAFTLPGMHLVHEGQTAGYRIKLPVQLGRRQTENADPVIAAFYKRLFGALRAPVFQDGSWELLQPQPSAPDNDTYVAYCAYLWTLKDERRMIIVNLSPAPAQCFLPLAFATFAGKSWLLEDLLNPVSYVRDGNAMSGRGLYLDMRSYGYHLFNVQRVETGDE